MKRYWATGPAMSASLLIAMTFALATGNAAFAQQTIGGGMGGFQETPAISTAGTGSFLANILAGDTQINFQLNYSGLSGPPSMAHIHLGQRGVAGGVVAFLCGGGTKPACPASGLVTGTITSADVQAVTAQGIAAGELSEFLVAIRAGVTYANVHTTLFGAGEIRGQIRPLN